MPLDAEEALIEQMGNDVVADGQWVRTVSADDTDQIKHLRACGRKAGRHRGVKVITHVTPPVGGHVDVWVIRNEQPSDDDELGQRRMQARMRAAVDAIPPRTINLLN